MLLLLDTCLRLAKTIAGNLASRRFLFQALDIGYQLMPAAGTWFASASRPSSAASRRRRPGCRLAN